MLNSDTANILSDTEGRMKVKTLEAQSYELMRERIITGEWAQGMHLKDHEIAAHLGVSATPVREALRKLASEGLVETVPYRGTFVMTMSHRHISELFSVRLGLELQALDAAGPFLCDDDFCEMQTAIDDFDSALHRENLSELLESDMRFHSLLVSAGRNEILAELYRQLTGRVQMLMAIADVSGRMASGNADHESILNALRGRQLTDAEIALRAHLIATRDCLLGVASRIQDAV